MSGKIIDLSKKIEPKHPVTVKNGDEEKTITLTPMEAQILGELPDDHARSWAYKNWLAYEQNKKFNSIIEKIKAKEAFLYGCLVGCRC